MKKLFLLLISGFLCICSFAQEAGKIGRTDIDAISKIGEVPVESISKIGNTSFPSYYTNCNEILNNNPGSPDGIYTIDPDGEGEFDPIECYCDMTTDGGGWTLVLLSNSSVAGCPRPYWTEVVNNVNLNGTLSEDITTFDLFLGVRNWNLLGTTARLDMGESPSNLAHRAYYTFSLNTDNNYALVMSDENITIGAEQSGMYTYHNGRPLTTRDADHDAHSQNCSTLYYESAWWYGACWSGSFWGGGLESFHDAPYWTGNVTYFNYGSIWLR